MSSRAGSRSASIPARRGFDMPCVRIATGHWAAGSEPRLIEAVQSALVSTFQISESDRDVVLDLYDEKRRIVATGRSDR